MKYLILDIDGCCNTPHEIYSGVHLSNDKVLRVRRIIENTGCQVVISSMWRKYYTERELSIMLDVTGLCGVNGLGPFEIFDTTDRNGPNRGEEVRRWIDQAKFFDPNLKYCIVDDIDEFLPEQKLYFVHIDGDIGITEKDADRVIEILTK